MDKPPTISSYSPGPICPSTPYFWGRHNLPGQKPMFKIENIIPLNGTIATEMKILKTIYFALKFYHEGLSKNAIVLKHSDQTF